MINVGDKIIVTELISIDDGDRVLVGEVGVVTAVQIGGQLWLGSDDNNGKFGWVRGVPFTPLMKELV